MLKDPKDVGRKGEWEAREGDISLVRGEEKDLLPDPGGVPQHRKDERGCSLHQCKRAASHAAVDAEEVRGRDVAEGRGRGRGRNAPTGSSAESSVSL